jgi:hypothetical protein
MNTLTIQTNNHWRPFVYRHDVPAKVLADQFDYHTHNGAEPPLDGYFCYRGYWYHTDMFMRVGYPGPFGQTMEAGGTEWHGSHADSFFSGILIRMSDDGETYQVATYYSRSAT